MSRLKATPRGATLRALVGVAALSGAVACTGSSVGDDDFTPVPTTPTPTPTATPVPTPPVTPFTAQGGWLAGTPAGELWFKATASFAGEVSAIRGFDPGAAGCDVFIEISPAETVFPGKTIYFLLDDTGICDSAAHDFRVDYTATGVPGLQSVTFTAVPTVNALDAGEGALLTAVSAHLGTTRRLRFRLTPAKNLEIKEVRLYQPSIANTPTATCVQAAAVPLIGNTSNLFDACDVTPGPDTVTGYQAVFRGKDTVEGDSFYAMVTFNWSSNGSLTAAGHGTSVLDPSLADFDAP